MEAPIAKADSLSNVELPGGQSTRESRWSTIRDGVARLALRIFHGMEIVGEVVANFLGLNDSKYQYVLDSMNEQEWKIAKEVHRKREEEYTRRKEAAASDSLEGGAAGSQTTDGIIPESS